MASATVTGGLLRPPNALLDVADAVELDDALGETEAEETTSGVPIATGASAGGVADATVEAALAGEVRSPVRFRRRELPESKGLSLTSCLENSLGVGLTIHPDNAGLLSKEFPDERGGDGAAWLPRMLKTSCANV